MVVTTIYTGDLLYKPFFIANSVQEQLIIEFTKKMVATYTVGDLTLMDYENINTKNRDIVIINSHTLQVFTS